MGYKNAPFHTTWYNFLNNDFSPLKQHPQRLKKYLQLWPRGHGKTTGIILYILWLIGNNPDIHIQIVSKTASQAEQICTAIMTTIEHHKRYRRLFGELKPAQPIKWTSQQFIVERKEISKNPTLKSSGLMGPITGGRSDLIVCDDIIDEENVRTHLQIEKANTWFNKVLFPTLYPWGGIIVIGTRWSYADLYSDLLEKWDNSVLKAIDKGKVLWAEYWPLTKLEKRREEIGTIIFNCQYQNDPSDMEGDLLKGEWLHPWDSPPRPTCEYYAAIDPSMGEYDYFGIAIGAFDRVWNKNYLVDVWIEHKPLVDILKNKIPLLNNQYRFVKVYFEKNFWQKLLLNVPELKSLPIVPIVTVRDKTSRFISMTSHFESKRILVNPDLLHNSKFYLEWIQYPHGQHDDGLDATEMLVSNMIKREAAKPVFKLI